MASFKSSSTLKGKINLTIFFYLMICVIICNHNYCVLTLRLDAEVGLTPSEIEQNVTRVFSSLSYTLCNCIVSKDGNSVLNFFLGTFYREYTLVLIFGEETQYLEFCSSVLIFNWSTLKNFDEIVSSIKKQTLYLISDQSFVEFSISEDNIKKMSSTKVVVVSLQDGKLYKMNKLFLSPPCLVECGISEIIKYQNTLHNVDLQGEVLKVATVDYFPFFITQNSTFLKSKYLKDKNYKVLLKPGDTDGVEDLVMKELALQLNFTIEYDIFYAGWGLVLPNGTWVTGIGKAMVDGKYDLAMANFWQVPSVYSAMDFGPSLSNNKMFFMVERPTQLELEFGVVFRMFTSSVWSAFLVVSILVAAFYWFSFYVERKIHGDEEIDQAHKKSVWASLMVIYGHFLSTICEDPSRNRSARVILVSWSIFTMLLRSLLSSGIVTRYTVPSFSPRIDSIQQLVEEQYYWTVQFYVGFNSCETKEGIFNFRNRWQNSFEKKYKSLEADEVELRLQYDRKMTFPVQLFNKNVVVINTYGVAGDVVHNYRLTKEFIKESHTSFGVKKESPILNTLTVTTLRFIESGLLDHWEDLTLRKWKDCDYRHVLQELDIPAISEAKPLKANIMLNEFYFLLVGLVISILVFICETIYWIVMKANSLQQTL